MSAAAQRGSLVPLPEYHRHGLVILTAFSFVSAAATSLLWLFITYKFLSYKRQKWDHTRRENKQKRDFSTNDLRDLTLGLDSPCVGSTRFPRLTELDRLANSPECINEARSKRQEEQEEEREEEEVRSPFPILVYNLLLADMMEAVAYALSIYWVANDGIIAPSPVCWAQGWLGSTSNLAASLFLTAISVSTFLTVGLGYKLAPWAVYATVIVLWVFDFGINGAGVIASVLHPGAPNESFYMRANVCNGGGFGSRQSESPRLTGYHPAFLVYPFVYIGCSVPLVVGRVTSLLGIDLGIYYFAFAGSILAANGLFNSILWVSTILFSAPQDVCDTGLDRFAFIKTPIRDYGHTVVISGPSSTRVPLAQISPGNNKKDWWWWRHGGMRGWGRSYASTHDMRIVHAVEMHSKPPPRPVEGPVIQMEVVTTVTSEEIEPGMPTKAKQ
ncbi:integral membrane protein [Colletotrichum graminicola]|nr:integral membrane protein [Colletotrichum graminicola]